MAVTVAMRTPASVTLPPKRASIESAGLPPLARSFAAKNDGMSLPVTIFDFFASAMLTACEFGTAETDMSGLAQVPALTAFVCALPLMCLLIGWGSNGFRRAAVRHFELLLHAGDVQRLGEALVYDHGRRAH